MSERKPDEYYKKKYGVVSEERFLQLPVYKEREKTEVGKVYRIKKEAELNTLNQIAYVKHSVDTPWGFVIEMKLVWVENEQNVEN